ncbi:MAG: DinB family protein [Planctomycetota bacterium]
MPDATTLAQAFRDAVPLFTRFLDGFDDTNRTTQAPGLANHAAWTLGHVALYLHRGAEAFDGLALPETDFIPSELGALDQFGTESVSFGSEPADEPDRYPTWARCEAVFRAAAERYALAVERATPEQLSGEVKWGSGTTLGAALAVRHIVHMSNHTGQLIDLRRALGMPRVVG